MCVPGTSLLIFSSKIHYQASEVRATSSLLLLLLGMARGIRKSESRFPGTDGESHEHQCEQADVGSDTSLPFSLTAVGLLLLGLLKPLGY